MLIGHSLTADPRGSVIVHDLHVKRVAVLPTEADAPLVVDADAPLALAVALEGLEPIAWGARRIDGAADRQHRQDAVLDVVLACTRVCRGRRVQL
jgi:hypothetical protein